MSLRERRLLIAMAGGLAAGWAGGYHKPALTRDEALTELAAITRDPDVLAEAAAEHVAPIGHPYWYAEEAAALLMDAGADPAKLEEYARQRRSVSRQPLDLDAMRPRPAGPADG